MKEKKISKYYMGQNTEAHNVNANRLFSVTTSLLILFFRIKHLPLTTSNFTVTIIMLSGQEDVCNKKNVLFR
jgi:hypothetical protein